MKFYQKKHLGLFCFLIILFVFGCKQKENENVVSNTSEATIQLFETLPANSTSIDFVNTLEETVESNYYQYMYTYIGGGVAAGDINNDGLIDLYFTANSGPDKLYLNQGDFKFEDITQKAGILNLSGFNTGVTMVDINNDGLLDIYVSRGGWKDEDGKFANLLYINNGDETFTERAKELGLADENRSIQATFFDFDKDNDLDVYISNTPDITGRTQILDLDKIESDFKTLKLKGSDRFYENDGNGHFTDISEKAGLRFDLGFGLNPQVGDMNNDGWLDVYVCNDFNGPDLAYLNNQDGTFTESRDQLFKHISFNSMGSDMADINNDGLLDLLTLDMNPEDYVRSKTTMAMTSVASFEEMVEKGYHYQYMHNMLQLNNGNGSFREISKMAGIANTDWSWSILSADFDLDGYNDVFVTNGVYRDVIDQDKNREILSELRQNNRKPNDEDFLRFAQMLPQQKLKNYFFRNNGDYTFEDTSDQWSDMGATFSNGALYADLDNDGDLDVVVNNINDQASILKNKARENGGFGNYLNVAFKGPKTNKFGIGSRVDITFKDGTIQSRELITSKGFLSSVSTILHFGLNENEIDNLLVTWADGKQQILSNVEANQTLTVAYNEANHPATLSQEDSEPLFVEKTFEHAHEESYFNDFDVQILLPHKLSQTGPAVAVVDVNNDGFDDVYLGGAYQQSGSLLMGSEEGIFQKVPQSDFESDENHEDQDALFFDADNDGDLDLYVVSGSYEFINVPNLSQDRLYLNEGGKFRRALKSLPEDLSSGSTVVGHDFDGDGDTDLFIGGRVVPGKYPYAPKSSLLVNENGNFKDVTAQIAPELEQIGMVTDANWADLNGDGVQELIVTGEWMGVEVLEYENEKFNLTEKYSSLKSTKGWWNSLNTVDVDGDGDLDIIAGNLGLNYKFHASKEKPFNVYTKDFDYNGVEDVILSKTYEGKAVPIRGKTCMTQQLPHLEQKIQSYQDFASKDLKGILGKGVESSLHYEVNEFRSGIFYNDDGKFRFEPFGNELQTFPINSIVFSDIDGDGFSDMILAGNNHMSEVETTRADAGIGAFLKGSAKGKFENVNHKNSGLFLDKDVRNVQLIDHNGKLFLLAINNNAKHQLYQVN